MGVANKNTAQVTHGLLAGGADEALEIPEWERETYVRGIAQNFQGKDYQHHQVLPGGGGEVLEWGPEWEKNDYTRGIAQNFEGKDTASVLALVMSVLSVGFSFGKQPLLQRALIVVVCGNRVDAARCSSGSCGYDYQRRRCRHA